MNEVINTTLEKFGMFIIGASLGACIMYFNMRDNVVQEEKVEITNFSVLTENDIEKIRYEGKKEAKELVNRMESNENKKIMDKR